MRGNAEDPTNQFMSIDEGIEIMNNNILGLKSQTTNLEESIEKIRLDPEKIMNEINEKKLIKEKNKNIIHEKMKILEGRNRMLQISMDKNIFYKKLVYVILAIAISIIIILLFVVSFFKSS